MICENKSIRAPGEKAKAKSVGLLHSIPVDEATDKIKHMIPHIYKKRGIEQTISPEKT